MTYILINCTSTGRAQDVETAANAGQLWGVDMGTTSKAASYGNYALIECSKTRNLALIDSIPDFDLYMVELSQMAPDSFSDASQIFKAWYLRGKL